MTQQIDMKPRKRGVMLQNSSFLMRFLAIVQTISGSSALGMERSQWTKGDRQWTLLMIFGQGVPGRGSMVPPMLYPRVFTLTILVFRG